MAIKTTCNTTISKNIVCVFRCHFCGEENILTQAVSETGSSATTYQPLSKKKKQARDEKLTAASRQNAEERVEERIASYEKRINEYRNTNGIPLQCVCQKCQKRQIWTQIPEIGTGMIFLAFAIAYILFALINDAILKESPIYLKVVIGMLFVGVPPCIAIIPGVRAYKNQKVADGLPNGYLPIIITDYNADTVMEKINRMESIPGINNEKNPYVNANNIRLNIIRNIILIFAGMFFTGNRICGHEGEWNAYSSYVQLGHVFQYLSWIFFGVFLIMLFYAGKNWARGGN